jgi:hypothetical protein
MAVFLAAAVLYSLFLGSAQILVRFEDLADEGRYYAMKGALTIFREYPLIGSGVATFGEVYYRYQPAMFKECLFNYTHSDWLQLLAETGLVGFLLVLTAWQAFFSSLVKHWRQRRDTFARGLGLGGLAALGAAVFHSLGEFPFHIPGMILIFASIAAITYLTLHHHHQGGLAYFSYPTLKFSGQRRLATGLVLGLMGLQLAFVYQVWHYWGAERAAPTETNSTRPTPKLELEDFRQALVLNPRNSRYYLGLAETLERRAGGEEEALREVEKSLQAAIFSSPADWNYHLKLGEFYLRRQKSAPPLYIPPALQELDAVVKLFPESGALHLRLASVLSWAEKNYPFLVPEGLRGRADFHFQQAVKLEPRLQKYIKMP